MGGVVGWKKQQREQMQSFRDAYSYDGDGDGQREIIEARKGEILEDQDGYEGEGERGKDGGNDDDDDDDDDEVF